LHNLHYYQELMADLRQAIEDERLEEFVREFYALRQSEAESD
jgi:queuine tRNA-ribosyltransferase